MTRPADRLFRPIARRLTRSRVVQRLASRPTNTRGDVLDRQIAALLWLQQRVPLGLEAQTVPAMRTAMRHSSWIGAPDLEVVRTRDEVVNGTRTRWYCPETPQGAFVFVHGGGWVVGDLDTHDAFCRTLALRTQRQVVSLDYPRAPEAPFPRPIYAVADLWRILHPRLGSSDVFLGGDSAGANLAHCACRVLRDAGDPLPDRQVLIYPGLDSQLRSASHAEFSEGFILSGRTIRDYLGHYAPDPEDPLGCPFDAPDLRGLPPAILTVAGFDPLRDEGLQFAERLRAAGVPVDLLDERGLTHGYIQYDGLVDEAARANQRLFDRITA